MIVLMALVLLALFGAFFFVADRAPRAMPSPDRGLCPSDHPAEPPTAVLVAALRLASHPTGHPA
jgi:hypothetical protein